MTENQKSWVFAVAVAMVFVVVSCCFVGSGSAALHQEVFVGVPAGYFDGVMPLGSVQVGGGVNVATVTWDDETYDFSFATDGANSRWQSPIYYFSMVQKDAGSSVPASAYKTAPYVYPGTGSKLRFNYVVDHLPDTMNLGPGTIACYAGQYQISLGRDIGRLFSFTIPGESTPTPTPTPTTPTPTPTADLMPEIQSFTVHPTLAYQYVYLDCDLVGLRGTSASVAGDVNTALNWNSTSSSWQGTISFSAPGDYTVHGVLSNEYGSVSSVDVLIHIYELPDLPVINDVSVDYDLGGYHPRLTMSVTFPAGILAHPDSALGVSWGDGDFTYYDGWLDQPNVPSGSPVVVQMDHVYQSEGYFTATIQATNFDGQTTQDVGIYVSELPPTPTPTTPEPTTTTPEPTTTTPTPTATTPTPTATTPDPTATTPAPTGTYPTPTFTIPTPITTVVIPTYDLDPYNPLGLGIASPGGEPPAPPAFPALVLPNLNILEGWGQNTSWSGLYTWYDGIVGSIVDPLGTAWAELMAPLVQYVIEVSAGVTSLFVAVSTWIYPAVAFAWEVSGYIYALVPLVVWICISAILWILVLALLMRLLSEPVWMIIRDLFGGRR